MKKSTHHVELRSNGNSGSVTSSVEEPLWSKKLMKVANFASILCAIDCTVLPIFVVLLSLIGVGSSAPATQQCVHKVGHLIANVVVLPVGSLVTAVNIFLNKKLSVFLSFIGLIFIYVTNSH